MELARSCSLVYVVFQKTINKRLRYNVILFFFLMHTRTRLAQMYVNFHEHQREKFEKPSKLFHDFDGSEDNHGKKKNYHNHK